MPEGVGYGPQNTSSVGLNLNVIGNHAYAFSGAVQINTSNVTHLDFTTGSTYLVGTLFFSGGLKMADITGGTTNGAQISFNDEVIGILKNDTETEDQPTDNTMPIIIPPYTNVKVEVITTGTTAGYLTSVLITGRIYGKIE